MTKARQLLIVLLIILVGVLLYNNCNTTREPYGNLYNNDTLNDQMLSRPTFNSNLDPQNMNMRSDPNAYGGFVRGNSTSEGNLASYNKINTFAAVPKLRADESGAPGTVDARDFVSYGDTDYEGLPGDNLEGSSQRMNAGDYGTVDGNFAALADAGTFQQTRMTTANKKYNASLSNRNPDTLKYTLPKDLLPAPDMRQPMARDLTDPSNFMYNRTVFAPLKKRNHNEADRIRGDLDIQPVKTGWFDVATVPQVDLVKGYFGMYNDILQTQDLQDIVYSRARDVATGADTSESVTKLTDLTTALNRELLTPSIKYASAPSLKGPIQGASDPFYNINSGNNSRTFQL